jgi:hypothetical protein
MRALIATILMAALIACSPQPAVDTAYMASDPCFPLPHPTLELGLWDEQVEAFVPLTEASFVPIQLGPQGGRYLSIGLTGTHLNAWTYIHGELEAYADGVLLSEAQPWLDFSCSIDSQEAFAALLPFDATADALHDTQLTLQVKVTDASGNHSRDEVSIQLVDPEHASSPSP